MYVYIQTAHYCTELTVIPYYINRLLKSYFTLTKSTYKERVTLTFINKSKPISTINIRHLNEFGKGEERAGTRGLVSASTLFVFLYLGSFIYLNLLFIILK